MGKEEEERSGKIKRKKKEDIEEKRKIGMQL